MSRIKKIARLLVPSPLFSLYHLALAYIGALVYGFPSRNLIVIGVTGTNGKSSTTEYINAICEEAGYKTALSNSIRTKIGADSSPSNGRSMPGRFFLQRFLSRAVRAGCSVTVIEMTSEGARQHRHRGIALNAFVFLNLAPEHIESHGSFEKYADAKLELARQLSRSPKRPRILVVNNDDAQAPRYLGLEAETKIAFSLSACKPYTSNDLGGTFTFGGREIKTGMPGEFSLKNALAAAEVGHALGVAPETIARGIARVKRIPGRLERIEAGQEFSVIVDYALTPDALEILYKTYATQKKICVFGSAGGGRDAWKRPVLGKLAEKYCEAVILTNDIAYGEPPRTIIEDIARGMRTKPEVLPDRREAIRRALELAQANAERARVAVLITGMGIDTEITAADESTMSGWSDAAVAREELSKLLER